MRKLSAREAISYGMYGDTGALQEALRGNRSYSPYARELLLATRELRDAIASGKVTACGRRENPGNQPAAYEIIPYEFFEDTSGLAVSHTGETYFEPPAKVENIPTWTSVRFDLAEIEKLWPKSDACADAWINADMLSHPGKKKDDRLRDCVAATNCTWREAKASFAKIPSNMKRGRGQRLTSLK